MRTNQDKHPAKNSEQKVNGDFKPSDITDQQFQKHKARLLKATYLYTSLNYSKLITDEILQHERDKAIDEKVFLKNKTLTRETLSQIFKIKLKHPIESYLVLKKPLTPEGLYADSIQFGKVFFNGSKVHVSKIQDIIKKSIFSLNSKPVILTQLAILKTENQKKYKDMLITGLLNYAMESHQTDNQKKLETSFLAGMLHDIGFLYLDPKYHDRKTIQFSIEDLKKIQAHTELGFCLLEPWFDSDIANAAMNHHIGEDNSGYPRQRIIPSSRISKLTGFTSAFLACLRKYSLTNALKIQDIYSRDKSYFGEKLTPFYKRDFYESLKNLDLQYNKTGQNVDIEFNRKYSVILHNFLVYIFDLGNELKKIDSLLLSYASKFSHRLELQNDIDDVFDHIKKLKIIIESCGKSPGLRHIMKDNLLASKILGDVEIISMELHRNNQFLQGLFSYLNTKSGDKLFESSVYKKAVEYSGNIKRNISDHLEKEVSVFNFLSSVSG
ncbi:MAG: HD domain-containing phosphohydrolase [Pseudomonadota bacterium]